MSYTIIKTILANKNAYGNSGPQSALGCLAFAIMAIIVIVALGYGFYLALWGE